VSASQDVNADDCEFWKLDVRDQDLGLVADRLERALRIVHSAHLLVDGKARKAIVAVTSCLPHPLLELILRALFNGHIQAPSIHLLTEPVLNAVAAGVRSALVIDIGWHETAVTAIYEYREVLQKRTDRASKMLCREMARVMAATVADADVVNLPTISDERHVPHAVAEDVVTRLGWCENADHRPSGRSGPEAHLDSPVRLEVSPTTTIDLPLARLAQPAETVFFDTSDSLGHVDDHHLPLHVLAWKCLLALPLDARASCMARIIITGGASNMPGLKTRLLAEIESLVAKNHWDPVMSYGSAANARKDNTRKLFGNEEAQADAQTGNQTENFSSPASMLPQETDDITTQLTAEAAKGETPPVKAVVRGVETLGAWAGASILTGLRIDAANEIKREDFLKHGLVHLSPAI